MLASLDLGLAMLYAPRGLACVVASVPLRDLLGVTTYEIHPHGVGVLNTHISPLNAMLICLPFLLCATRLACFVPPVWI